MNGKYLIIFLSCFVFSTLNSAPLTQVYLVCSLTTEFDPQLKAAVSGEELQQSTTQQQQWQVFA